MASIERWVRECSVSTAALRQDPSRMQDEEELFAHLVEIKRTAKSLLSTLVPGDRLAADLTQLTVDVSFLQLMCVRAGQSESRVAAKIQPLECDELNEIVVIVLGCKDPVAQRARIVGAHDLVSQLLQGCDHEGKPLVGRPTTIRLVFSGGGSWIQATEAQKMREQWEAINKDQCVQIILEEDSLDTVGNALFSFSTLQQLGCRISRVYCVTHKYHVPRTDVIFKKVFGPTRVVVVGIPNDDKGKLGRSTLGLSFDQMAAGDAELARAVHELKGEYTTTSTLFSVPHFGSKFAIDDGDTQSLMMLLFVQHGLYRDRHDLKRKYLSK